MPWNEVDVDEQRMRFVIRATSGKESMTGLCREFTISRPTGYEWRRRYREVQLLSALQERSRRPHHSPRLTATRKEQRVVALRQQTGWGAKKLRVLLAEEEIPLAVRTIHRILQRHKHFQAAAWEEVRLDIDKAAKPDIVADITDMNVVPSANRTNFGRWTPRGSIRCKWESATRCPSWMITAGTPWGFTRCRS